MNKNFILAIGITILFLGLVIQPSIATIQQEEKINVEPKDYLFRTIIDIANNSEVKELLEQYKGDLIKIDIDGNVYRKILFRSPRLLFNMFFTKPSITYEYLDKYCNIGIEITNILGEDKALEIIETIKFTDTKVLDEFNNIIINDKNLTYKLSKLNEMNKELKTNTPYLGKLILCGILFIIATIGIVVFIFSTIPLLLFIRSWENTLGGIFFALFSIFSIISFILINPFVSFCLG